MLFMVVLTSHAETTTDNLLNNDSFTTDTSDWELSDNNQNKVKRDPNTYSDSASKSIRFRYQDGYISQDIDMDKLPDNHIVKQIHMNFQSIGCGNSGSQWCTAGADDTVTNTVTLTSTDTAEVISNTTAVPYEDGWSDYSFTEDVTGDFNTDNLNINLNVAGDDTGNSSNWYGPIVDNISFTLTIEEYIAPVVVEPIVVQPIVEIVVEPIVETVIEPIIENTVIEGLSLDTEIVTDVIIDTPVQPEVPVNNLPELPDLPSVEIEIPTVIEVPQEIEIVEEIPEIQEIEVEEVAEVTEEVVEQPEELKETDMEEDLAENEEIEETESSEEEEKAESEEETEVAESKDEPKVETKQKPKQSKSQVSETTKKNTGIEQVNMVNLIGLQEIPQTITILETVSLTQEMIYEQDISAITSGATYDSLISSSSSRWVRMVDVRPKHTFSGYGR